MLVHAHGLGRLHVLGEGIGGHGHNGHLSAVVPIHGPDGPGSVVAVHPGHLNVHENNIIVSVRGLAHLVHRLHTVPGVLHRQAGHGQEFLGNLRVEGVVLHQHGPTAGEVHLL